MKMKSLLEVKTRKDLAIKDCAQSQLFTKKADPILNLSGAQEFEQKNFQNQNNQELFEAENQPDACKVVDDNDLIVIIRTQNPEVYRELFSRYQKKLFSYIYHLIGNKEETEDILQNVFSKTYKNIESFDISRKFSSWIYRIAHNEAVNFLKRKSKRYTISWDDVSTSKDKLESASIEEGPEEMLEHQEIIKEIDWALEKLPQKYQQILKLRYFEERSYEDIGKFLDKPVNTVGTLINRAKRKLLEVVVEDNVIDKPKKR